MRSTTLASPLLLELQRAILRARRVAARARRAARPGRGLLRARARAPPRRGRRRSRCTRRARPMPCSRSRPRPIRASSSPSIPRSSRAWPARAARCARRRCAGAGARRCGRRPRCAEQAGMALDEYAAFVARALFLDQPDPVAAWGGLRAFQERADRPPRPAPASCASRREGTDLTPARPGTHVGQLRRQAQHAQRRGLHRPARGQRRGQRALHVRSSPAGVDVDGVELELRAGEVVAGEGRTRRRLPAAARWPPTTARGAWARSASGRTSASTAPSARSSSTRRSAAPCTSRSAAPTPRRAARTPRPLHWDLICDLRGRRAG